MEFVIGYVFVSLFMGIQGLSLICPEVCTKEYKPVCGLLIGGNIKKTFDNLCLMQQYNCHAPPDQRYEFLYDGECKAKICPDFCPYVYEPVCAGKGGFTITFGNQCQLDQYNCFAMEGEELAFLHKGECHSKSYCPEICPAVYEPVCAKNGSTIQTFGNQCELDRHNCNATKDQKFEFLHAGECTPGTCPQICPFVYEPVCARNGRTLETFTNLCFLNQYNCGVIVELRFEYQYDGKCQPNVCPIYCLEQFNPVCAVRGDTFKTFGNRCQLDQYNCRVPPNEAYVFQYAGQCNLR